MTQPRDEGGGVPMAVRHGGDAAFVKRCTSLAPGHVCRPRFHPESFLIVNARWEVDELYSVLAVSLFRLNWGFEPALSLEHMVPPTATAP